MTRRLSRRRLATLAAVFTLLVQQNLVPVLHFALGAELAGVVTPSHAGHQAQRVGGCGGDDSDADHGPCHFCRIFGAALPPPPIAELQRLEPARFDLALFVAATAPRAWLSRAHGVRAPPLSPV